MTESPARPPRWETAILCGSFVLLWVWFVVRQGALRVPGGSMPAYWHILLLVPFVALVWVTVRRMQRVKAAFIEERQRMLGGPPRR